MTATLPRPASSDSRFPTPDSLRLPPTARDFDILHMSHVLHVSTRQIAEKHGLSQTRVRQVVKRVCEWLAAALPVKTEAEQEQEARLAQHLAADQFRHQSEQLQNFFEATGDPKYLRQQTRVIAALARLGIVPGTIEALAADLTEGPLTGAEPQQPWSEEDAWANQSSTAHCPPTTDNNPLPTADCPLTTGNPSVRDCSPSRQTPGEKTAAAGSFPAASDAAAGLSEQQVAAAQEELKGLQLLERRLLAVLESTDSNNHERRESLESNLFVVREEMACIEIRISPHQAGAALRLSAEPAAERADDEAVMPAPVEVDAACG
jgi:hypothetical protein